METIALDILSAVLFVLFLAGFVWLNSSKTTLWFAGIWLALYGGIVLGQCPISQWMEWTLLCAILVLVGWNDLQTWYFSWNWLFLTPIWLGICFSLFPFSWDQIYPGLPLVAAAAWLVHQKQMGEADLYLIALGLLSMGGIRLLVCLVISTLIGLVMGLLWDGGKGFRSTQMVPFAVCLGWGALIAFRFGWSLFFTILKP